MGMYGGFPRNFLNLDFTLSFAMALQISYVERKAHLSLICGRKL
jgi:hypothetical protein